MNSKRVNSIIVILSCIFFVNAVSAFSKSTDELMLPKVALEETPKLLNETNLAKPSKQYIKDIEITGNSVVKPEYILNRMKLNRGDEYNRDFVQQDLKSIYQTGFFSEQMKAIPIENPDKSITLKIILEENIPITDFTIEGNEAVSNEEILSYLLPLKGEPQNIVKINAVIDQIQACYAEKGYILARISSISDDADGTLNIEINEGKINKILIEGNEKTKKFIIERNILTEPGMVYNEDLIKEDLVRLYATQAYKDVNREIEPSLDNPNEYDVTIKVREQRTATLSVGGGLDSATGIFGSFGIVDNNFRGLNQRVGFNFLAGSGVVMSDSSVLNRVNLQAELSFFEPYFINADTSLMSKLFFRDFGSYQIPLAIEQRFGAEATIANVWKRNKNITWTLSAGLENVNVREGDFNKIARLYALHKVPISERAKQLEGGLFLSLTPGMVYDTRDSAINPRSGTLSNVKWEEALCLNGFNKTYGKLTGSIKHYYPIATKSSLSIMGKVGGQIHGDMPEVMAYRLGGPYSVRGFKMSAVGTGRAMAMGSIELATPVFFLDRIKKLSFLQNVRFTMFVDAGKVFNETITDKIYERPMQAISAGVGLKIYIPGLGPLSVDYGIPLTNPGPNGNRSGYFTFGVGDLMY